MKVLIDLETRHEQLEEPSAGGSEAGFDRGTDTYHLVGVTAEATTKDYGEEVIGRVIDDKVFVLIEDYASGDTFGRTESSFKVVAVYGSYSAAEKGAANAPKCSDYFGGHNQFLIEEVRLKLV